MRTMLRRILCCFISILLLLIIAIAYADEDTIIEAYERLTPDYMNAHMNGLAEEFSLETGIVEETVQLLLHAGYIDNDNYGAGKYLFEKCEKISKEKGIPWKGLISIPFLYKLYDIASNVTIINADIARKTVGKWTRATMSDGSFFIGETDADNKMINGIYYYSDMNALYWGSFKNDLRNGKGCILYQNNDCYNGSWEDDQMSGYGIYYFGGQSTGEFYAGHWSNNMMNGEGSYVLNGQSYKAIWTDNTPERLVE